MSYSAVKITNTSGTHPVVLVCEHASAFMPTEYNNLGLDKAILSSHIAWDPGASQIAQHLSRKFDAVLVEGGVSRLLYDCNRPTHSPTAMPDRSEIYDIPGNKNLTDTARNMRIQLFYKPFENTLKQTIATHSIKPIIITLHSFNPVYNGAQRNVEIGVLHDSDQRLATAMLSCSDETYNVQRNEPYGPEDGVTHTLVQHGVKNQILNVMIEIRNDLITTTTSQNNMANYLHDWISRSLDTLGVVATPQPQGIV